MNLLEIKDYSTEALKHYTQAMQFTEDLADMEADEYFKERSLIDIMYFVAMNHHIINDVNAEQLGHNLWLTRNNHGTGFWCRDFEFKETLTKESEKMHQVNVYLTADDKISID
ncbi:hypothetical protein COB55_03110 [Candidatus Wolfebacteria bacterium]|nr:MAG: hypothetical protein COB55_03110 [Candidatus Wolfebacteria bacterium]